ncbi:hypothetical protein bsdtb5_33630 [Anaeromicropila herbilytica]|uniref:Uncharacterized protein n=2 Tax=Anaeromicropila herbilytica TaxID=2785025 RepID=A0A7R7ENI7_9FIRM|nr:hypothetical protein bsdtb5_33630 [Anaeromicropila herbilytica]
MYLLFRLHSILPSQYQGLGRNEKRILRVFIEQELKEYREGGEENG